MTALERNIGEFWDRGDGLLNAHVRDVNGQILVSTSQGYFHEADVVEVLMRFCLPHNIGRIQKP